jgi:importin subunit alpha-6/7
LVERNIIRALVSVLKMNETRVLAVALEGLDNILRSGQEHFTKHSQENRFSLILENEGGIDLIEQLQMHPNHQIYQRALKILDAYFQDENDNLVMDATATSTNFDGNRGDNEQMKFMF